MNRIKYLKWIAEESPTTTQQLLARLNRARHYTPDMKEHQSWCSDSKKGIVVGLRQSTNCIREFKCSQKSKIIIR